MQNELFSTLSLVIVMGAGMSMLMHLLRQPLIIGHIITGIIAGPAALGLIHADASFSGMSEIGVALLLFIIGLDLSLKVFRRVSKAVIVTTTAQIGVITSLGYAASRLLHFSKTESFVLGLGLAMSSTIIIIKLLTDKKETSRLYAQIAIGILLLQDVAATIAKIALSTKAHEGSTVKTLTTLGLRSLLLILGMYLVVKVIIPKISKSLNSNKELLLIFSLGWGLGVSLLFKKAGLSIEVGALFAGISLASIPFSSEMASRLKPLRDFFLVIFFITLGQTLSPHALGGVIKPALALCAIVLVVKPIVVLMSMGYMGYTKRASFKTAIAMGQVSEFSLVLLASAVAYGFASERTATTLTLVALITFTVSTYLIKYDNLIYSKLERHLRLFERRITKRDNRMNSSNHPIVLFGYRKGGHEFLKTFSKMDKKFIVVDYDPENVESLERQHIPYLYGDATDPELLDELNLIKTKLVVSTIADIEINKHLALWLSTHNANAVFVCSAERAEQASELYSLGASYVMMPHYIGSEKIGTFIRKNGFNKSEFKSYREKHLVYLQSNFDESD